MQTKKAKIFHWGVYTALEIQKGEGFGYSGDIEISSHPRHKPVVIRVVIRSEPDGVRVLDMEGTMGIGGNTYTLKAIDVARMLDAFNNVGKQPREPFSLV